MKKSYIVLLLLVVVASMMCAKEQDDLQQKIMFDSVMLQMPDQSVEYQIAENYYLRAKNYYLLQQNDSARLYLEKSRKLVNPDFLFGNLQLTLLHSRIFFSEENYQQAETELLGGLTQIEELIETADLHFYNLLSDYYDLLSQIQEKQGKIKEALDASRESLKYELKFFELSDAEYIQDLRVKRDLDNKQRTIDRLTEVSKIYQQNRILYFSVGVLFFIVIMLVIFLSRRKRKIVQGRLLEAELVSQLEQEKNIGLTTKMEENEQKYQRLLSENRLRQINSYLAGLETERSRLSKELHDNIANNILSINLQIQNQNDINTSDISHQLTDIQNQVRNISHELIPPVFQYASFAEILQDYIRQQNQNQQG